MDGSNLHMWFVLLTMAAAIVSFVRERIPIEVTSVAILTVLLLFGQFFPLVGENGRNMLDANALLAGFSNPSLIAVLALLVMGQAMIYTDALRLVTGVFMIRKRKFAWVALIAILVFVLVFSAFINNTPLVVICIPLIQIIANSTKVSQSRMMIPLSYAAILGGMMTVIGSSTNLLVSSSLQELGYEPLSFFAFLVPGSILAAVGFLYVVFILPRLLPDRTNMAADLKGSKKEFVAELDIDEDSHLIGQECVNNRFPDLGDISIKLIQRGGHLILPPFEGYKIEAGDVLIVAAGREALTQILAKYPGYLFSEEKAHMLRSNTRIETPVITDDSTGGGEKETRVLAEIMITPASRILDMSLDHVGFHKQFGTIVLGIQRRARVVRRRLGRIRLEPGDVLLIAGRASMVKALRDNPDFIVLSGSKRDLPRPGKAPIAGLIFLLTIGSAALGLISIPVAAITGSIAMIGTGCLNVRQAVRALDRRIFLLVGSMLALGSAMQITGGALFIADSLLALPFVDSPLTMAAVLFVIVAISTNILTNNACAILFTPVAVNLVKAFDLPPALEPQMILVFAVTVIFAANCSFATPIGYQTNLLVMGPGHYRFRDFVKGGVPLAALLWVTYILVAKFYFGLS